MKADHCGRCQSIADEFEAGYGNLYWILSAWRDFTIIPSDTPNFYNFCEIYERLERAGLVISHEQDDGSIVVKKRPCNHTAVERATN